MPVKNTTLPNPNPSGLCQCGCGQAAPIAKMTSVKAGKVKGFPQRYVAGHNRRRTAEDYEVDPVTGCWNWLRTTNNNGYGQKGTNARMTTAHEWYWVEKNGSVPEGLELDHVVCQNRRCCNPDHLEPVTHAINTQRGKNAKLTREQADEILALKGTLSQTAIARRFCIDPSCVSRIHAGKSWA